MRKLVFAIGLLLPLPAVAQSSSSSTGYTLNGMPTVPTPPAGTNTNQIATTAFVMANNTAATTTSGSGTPTTTNMSASTVALPGLPSRTLAARAADVYNARDYGALGTNTYTTLSAQFSSSATASLAAFASQSVSGSTPYSWMTNPMFGLTFAIPTSVDQGGAGKALTFLESLSGINGWSATVAAWQDPAHGNYLLQPGMQVSGSCVASGTTVSAVGRTPGVSGYGTVTLSQASSSDCASGTNITFTISPSQLQTLTADWLGIQGAMAGAWSASSGGSVYIPGGTYILNHSLINAGGVTDTNIETPNLDIHGDGVAETRLTWPSDLGQDQCGISEATRGPNNTSLSTYHDFRLMGPSQALTFGTVPNQMDGLCIGAVARVYGIRASYMHAGLNGIKDHWSVRDSTFPNNGYGIYFAPYTSTLGNQTFDGGNLTANMIASVGIASTDQIDSSFFANIHTGFGPYGFYKEMPLGNIVTPIGAMLTNNVFDSLYIEGIGDAWIYAAGTGGIVNNNTFIGEAFYGVGTYSGFNVPGTSVKAAIYATEFDNNVMINTAWGSYSTVSDAIIEMTSDCERNEWINDTAFPFNATATVPAMICPNGIRQDRFETAAGTGVFRKAGAAVTANEVLADQGYLTVGPFSDGQPFAGIAASPAGSSNTVGVMSFSDNLQSVNKASSSQNINGGQSVFATTGGVAGGLDSTGAIGTAVSTSPAGTSTVWITLDAGSKGGANGAATGLAAAGSSQSSAYQITSASSQFTNVPSGSGAILTVVPVGTSVTIYNDGANPMKVYPPVGSQIGSNAANAAISLASGTSASFRRLSTTLWHQ